MTDRWMDRLSEYLDDGLSGAERAELEEHLTECVECRSMLDELRCVVRQANALPDRMPAPDLWPRIRARIEEGADIVPIGTARPARVRRRFSITFPQAAAAAVALMLVGGGTAWTALRPETTTQVAEVTPPAAANPATVLTGYQPPPEVQRRLAELEATLAAARDRLDPETVGVIVKNLAIVETAVEEAMQALARDPANEYLREHLVRTLQTKVDVLERANALTRAET
jgi:hypothetical protein